MVKAIRANLGRDVALDSFEPLVHPLAQEQPAPERRVIFDRFGVLLGEVRDQLDAKAQEYHARGLDSSAHSLDGLARGLGDLIAYLLGHDATHPTPAERAEQQCRSPAQDLLLCPDSACGWMGRCLAAEPFQAAERAEQPPRDAVPPEQPLPDPHGCRSCTHPDCGRFDGPRSVECRAMAEGACARPPRDAVQQGLTEERRAEVVAWLRKEAESEDYFGNKKRAKALDDAATLATLKGQP